MACSAMGAPVSDGGPRNIFLYQYRIGGNFGASISSSSSPTTSGASLISSTASSPSTPSFSTFGSQTFTMDAQTGSYTFGYDTGPCRELFIELVLYTLLNKLRNFIVITIYSSIYHLKRITFFNFAETVPHAVSHSYIHVN
jgi:hypothetical protein